jgi:hypothetical protein
VFESWLWPLASYVTLANVLELSEPQFFNL